MATNVFSLGQSFVSWLTPRSKAARTDRPNPAEEELRHVADSNNESNLKSAVNSRTGPEKDRNNGPTLPVPSHSNEFVTVDDQVALRMRRSSEISENLSPSAGADHSVSLGQPDLEDTVPVTVPDQSQSTNRITTVYPEPVMRQRHELPIVNSQLITSSRVDHKGVKISGEEGIHRPVSGIYEAPQSLDHNLVQPQLSEGYSRRNLARCREDLEPTVDVVREPQAVSWSRSIPGDIPSVIHGKPDISTSVFNSQPNVPQWQSTPWRNMVHSNGVVCEEGRFRLSSKPRLYDSATAQTHMNNIYPQDYSQYAASREPQIYSNMNNYGSFRDNETRPRCADIHPRRREKDPATFDGESTEWVDYLKHFNRVAEWNGWSYKEKAIQLAMSLKNTAQRVLSDLPEAQIRDFDMLVNALNRRFNPAERETAYRCEFRNRRRQKGETIPEFGYALRRLASKAFPTISTADRECWVVDQFINGLTSIDMRRHTQFGHPNTLDSAMALATEYESFEAVQTSGRKPPQAVSNTSVSAVTRPAAAERTSLGDDSKFMLQVTQTMQDISRQVAKLQQELAGKSKKEGRPRIESVECFRCHAKGHYQSHCPLNKSGSSQGNLGKSVYKSAPGSESEPRELSNQGKN